MYFFDYIASSWIIRLYLLSGCRCTVRWTAWRLIIWQWYLWSRCSRSSPWTQASYNSPESWSCATRRSSRWARTHDRASHCVIRNECVIWHCVQDHMETDGEYITVFWRAGSPWMDGVQLSIGVWSRECFMIYCNSALDDNAFVLVNKCTQQKKSQGVFVSIGAKQNL